MESNNPSAPYSIRFEHRPAYLYAYVEGEHDSYQISKRYWLEVLDACRRGGYKRVLIEEAIEEVISTTDMFQLASELPNLGALGIKVAFVDRFIDHDDLNKFGELVAVNRGVNGKAFTELGEAERWLVSD